MIEQTGSSFASSSDNQISGSMDIVSFILKMSSAARNEATKSIKEALSETFPKPLSPSDICRQWEICAEADNRITTGPSAIYFEKFVATPLLAITANEDDDRYREIFLGLPIVLAPLSPEKIYGAVLGGFYERYMKAQESGTLLRPPASAKPSSPRYTSVSLDGRFYDDAETIMQRRIIGPINLPQQHIPSPMQRHRAILTKPSSLVATSQPPKYQGQKLIMLQKYPLFQNAPELLKGIIAALAQQGRSATRKDLLDALAVYTKRSRKQLGAHIQPILHGDMLKKDGTARDFPSAIASFAGLTPQEAYHYYLSRFTPDPRASSLATSPLPKQRSKESPALQTYPLFGKAPELLAAVTTILVENGHSATRRDLVDALALYTHRPRDSLHIDIQHILEGDVLKGDRTVRKLASVLSDFAKMTAQEAYHYWSPQSVRTPRAPSPKKRTVPALRLSSSRKINEERMAAFIKTMPQEARLEASRSISSAWRSKFGDNAHNLTEIVKVWHHATIGGWIPRREQIESLPANPLKALTYCPALLVELVRFLKPLTPKELYGEVLGEACEQYIRASRPTPSPQPQAPSQNLPSDLNSLKGYALFEKAPELLRALTKKLEQGEYPLSKAGLIRALTDHDRTLWKDWQPGTINVFVDNMLNGYVLSKDKAALRDLPKAVALFVGMTPERAFQGYLPGPLLSTVAAPPQAPLVSSLQNHPLFQKAPELLKAVIAKLAQHNLSPTRKNLVDALVIHTHRSRGGLETDIKAILQGDVLRKGGAVRNLASVLAEFAGMTSEKAYHHSLSQSSQTPRSSSPPPLSPLPKRTGVESPELQNYPLFQKAPELLKAVVATLAQHNLSPTRKNLVDALLIYTPRSREGLKSDIQAILKGDVLKKDGALRNLASVLATFAGVTSEAAYHFYSPQPSETPHTLSSAAISQLPRQRGTESKGLQKYSLFKDAPKLLDAVTATLGQQGHPATRKGLVSALVIHTHRSQGGIDADIQNILDGDILKNDGTIRKLASVLATFAGMLAEEAYHSYSQKQESAPQSPSPAKPPHNVAATGSSETKDAKSKVVDAKVSDFISPTQIIFFMDRFFKTLAANPNILSLLPNMDADEGLPSPHSALGKAWISFYEEHIANGSPKIPALAPVIPQETVVKGDNSEIASEVTFAQAASQATRPALAAIPVQPAVIYDAGAVHKALENKQLRDDWLKANNLIRGLWRDRFGDDAFTLSKTQQAWWQSLPAAFGEEIPDLDDIKFVRSRPFEALKKRPELYSELLYTLSISEEPLDPQDLYGEAIHSEILRLQDQLQPRKIRLSAVSSFDQAALQTTSEIAATGTNDRPRSRRMQALYDYKL